ncbi:MAG: hypothetical protein JSR64_17110 [Nitrospira sp.]|nr:hypothetical protein [Nitrospira sp.]
MTPEQVRERFTSMCDSMIELGVVPDSFRAMFLSQLDLILINPLHVAELEKLTDDEFDGFFNRMFSAQ